MVTSSCDFFSSGTSTTNQSRGALFSRHLSSTPIGQYFDELQTSTQLTINNTPQNANNLRSLLEEYPRRKVHKFETSLDNNDLTIIIYSYTFEWIKDCW